MDHVTVDKGDLITTIRRNRDAHREIFERAQEAYRAKWIALLDERLRDAERGHKINRLFALPEPEDHTADFDTALRMLEWEVEGEVELTRRDFERFVENRWEWAQSFATSTVSYIQS